MSTTAGNGKLSGKVAIVTASTEGIGFAIAHRLGLDGVKVVVSSRKQTKVDMAMAALEKENIDVFGLVCHVAKPEHRQRLIEETVKRYGGIDILISNAAANPYFAPMLGNLNGTRGGSIVIVSSIAGYILSEVTGPYVVSKTYLLGLVKALTPQCATMKICVNGLAPGLIQTSFSSGHFADPNTLKQALQNIPLRRVGKPADMAGMVSFMASDDAAYMTGETVVIASGMTSRL